METSSLQYLIKEWSTKNTISLLELKPRSNKRVWWICEKGHEWEAQVDKRINRGQGCPFCSGRRATIENNLAVKYPEIAKEWHPTKNKELTPHNCTPKSGKKVWWLGSCTHEWETIISHRTSQKSGCPYCTSKIFSYQKSLEFLRPELVKEWHPTKNTTTPDKVFVQSGQTVWWVCNKDSSHEWKMSIQQRTKNNSPCPHCNKNRANENYNFALLHPNLLQEWDFTKNTSLDPKWLTSNSHHKVWWICSKGHEWQEIIRNRVHNRNCPYCSNHKVSEENNLLVNFPDIAKELHPIKNGDLKSKDIIYGSNQKVWWLCSKDTTHEWETRIYSRTSGGSGCPYCCLTHTNLEKFIEAKLNIQKFNKAALEKSEINYRPDYRLSENLYLNVDGLYWHSVTNKDKNYHFKMRESYGSEGKRIFQFYEDEIYNKWPIVESIINNTLGKISVKLNARDCIIKRVNSSESEKFYTDNHLMGNITIAKHYGLYLDQELISLMSIKKIKNNIEISRFGSKININIRGGFQKLLSYIINLYKPKQVISFCDLRYANGGSYKKAGFKLVSISQGWQWTDYKERYNRLLCKAGNDKSEKENALEKDWIKIYDAGQAKYVKDIN